MKKYIFALITIFSLSGCQQALNEFHQSLDQAIQNLNAQDSATSFDSLAEEAEYKKQQNEQENKVTSRTLSEEEFYQEYDNLYLNNAKFLEKYAVKKTESLDSIDTKFKNRTQLFKEKVEDSKKIDMKFSELQDYKYSKYRNSQKFQQKYHLSKSNKMEEPYIINLTDFGKIGMHTAFFNTKSLEDYTNYLKQAYENYDARQANIEKKEKQKIENKVIAKKVQLERDKVKTACDNWLSKSKKAVYSLGVGDRIVDMSSGKAGMIFIIRAVEKNTFLVKLYDMESYVQKSNYVPYNSISNAPSKYCYE